MNILLLSYDYPPNPGGVANIAYQVTCQLNKLGEKMIVVAQKTKGDREFDKNNKFITYRCINIFFLRELALILFLPYIVVKHKIDIIYMLIWHQGGLATFLTSGFLNTPYILHTHGLELLDYKRTLLDKIKYSLFRQKYKRLIFKNAGRIIAVSNYTKGIVAKLGTREDKINVIYNSVDINRFKPGLDTSEIIAKHKLEGKRILLTISRLKKRKGHDVIIKLMPQLLQKIPNIVYLVVGSGKNRDSLESLIKEKDLQNNIIFTGYVDDLNLLLYYNACDIFIMLAKERLDIAEFEGFGLVFLEANSCCKPVIGARTGGIPEAIVDGKTGYLVNPDNNQEIMNKIVSLLENKELANKLGGEGRRRIIREGLIWEPTGKKIQSILISETEKSRCK